MPLVMHRANSPKYFFIHLPTVGPEGILVNITITSSLDRDPSLGEELSLVCEISPNALYQNPAWHGPNEELFPVADLESKITYIQATQYRT